MRRPTSSPPELPGYSYVRVLGSGGFSDVFLYDQQLPKRRVAVKVLLLDELTPANRAAFVAEANLMAQLSAHPYIVTIYHADVASDDRPYFVMEYCSGPSLGERYKQAPLAVADALRTGVRLSSAVQTAHQAGILHRDIKPANVLSNDYGWPALTDFGISSAVDDALPAHTTTVAGAVGDTSTSGTSGQVGLSVPWSPPEMFEDDPDPDVRSDVFSLAATIWTVLAGQTPFEVKGRGNGTLDLIGRIERGAITPMDRTDIPRSLIAVLQKGMATEREDRFASALDFGRALQRVEMELGYARTELEVPNLHLEAPERPADTGGADETRVRQVATIEAQPVAAAPPPGGADETRVRSTTTIEAQPSAAHVSMPPAAPSAPVTPPVVVDALPSETVVRPRGPAPQQPPPAQVESVDPAPTRSGRGRVVGIVVGVLAALVVAAVVVGIVLFGGSPEEAGPTPGASSSPDAVVPTIIPVPELASAATAEGTVVTFPVTNPDPEDGDRLVWRLSRADQPQLKTAEGDAVVVDGYTEGTPLCVDIMILRAGKTSDPLTTCYPPA
ncbi:serine/threonine-protein kinase [Protaetiibacter intestinalis]|uniref:non-specific serine/threonine protein kinase n=1 Tax=Protaetiibacter intestinalis TaxID=2419774 RepID=A0A387B9I7_9MICO|nr:serine/threonine-protein kinase [Protaetiibacter intestinalis]AYF98511.1 serine/threonine protein kinase [Protaetiibacter intestinalis]